MDLLPVGPEICSFEIFQDGGQSPSWKISNDHISGMSFPIHFHELQGSFGGVQGKIMCEELLEWSQSKIFLVSLYI